MYYLREKIKTLLSVMLIILQLDKDTDCSQDSLAEIQIKDEPEDAGYEHNSISANISEQNSTANSRDSSPLPPIHFEGPSPQQNPESASAQIPLNDLFAGSTIRSQLQGAIDSKKMDSIQDIIEGLLKKNETLLAMSDAGIHKPRSHQVKIVRENSVPVTGKSCAFPVSSSLQAQIVPKKKVSTPENTRTRMKHSKCPTLGYASVLRDKTNFTYALMESNICEDEIEKILNVEKHELVCGIGSKSYIEDQSSKLVTPLDVGIYWCNFCPYTTTNKSLLVHHTLEHRFACKFCAYESFCRSDIVRHMLKLHPEFHDNAGRFYYCTFLSDYLRVKTSLEKKESGDSQNHSSDDCHRHSKGRKRKSGSLNPPGKKNAKLDTKKTPVEHSTSNNTNNCKVPDHLHTKFNDKDSDYDLFDMEVEEICKPGMSQENPCAEELVPEIYSSAHIPETAPFPVQLFKALPPRKNLNASSVESPIRYKTHTRGKMQKVKSGSSGLYWSCGYCSFQSISQSEVKDHSNVEHTGKPHRYVALIKNPPTSIPSSKSNKVLEASGSNTVITNTTYKNACLSPHLSNNSVSSVEENAESLKDPSKAVKGKKVKPPLANESPGDKTVYINSVQVKLPDVRASSTRKATSSKKALYTCYHCAYTANSPSSMRAHIYYKHKGKSLVAFDSNSEPRQHIFFCAREDCSFKSETRDGFLNHVDWCTPWNKLQWTQVDSHVVKCLEQTIAFAKMLLDKVIENELERPVIMKTGDFEPLCVSTPTKPDMECREEPADEECTDKMAADECVDVLTGDKCCTKQADEMTGDDRLDVVTEDSILEQADEEDIIVQGEDKYIEKEDNWKCTDVDSSDKLQFNTDVCGQETVDQVAVSGSRLDSSLIIDHDLDVDTNVNILSQSLSSNDSFLPVGFVDVQCDTANEEQESNLSILPDLNETQTLTIAELDILTEGNEIVQQNEMAQKLTFATIDYANMYSSESQQIVEDGREDRQLMDPETRKVHHSEFSKNSNDDLLMDTQNREMFTMSSNADKWEPGKSHDEHVESHCEPRESDSGHRNSHSRESSSEPRESDSEPRESSCEPIESHNEHEKSHSESQELHSEYGKTQSEHGKCLITKPTNGTNLDLSSGHEVELADGNNTESGALKNRQQINNNNSKSPKATSPLKLTFKLVGNKTVCSIKGLSNKKETDSRSSEHAESSSSSSTTGSEEESEVEGGQVPKWLEELIDSTGDSESEEDTTTTETCIGAVKEEIEETKPSLVVPTSQTSAVPVETVQQRQLLTCLPARTAAVKALSKMKPALEESFLDDECEWRSKSKKSSKKCTGNSSHSQSRSNSQIWEDDSKAKTSSFDHTVSSLNTNVYACKYCSDISKGSLQNLKAHVLSQHGSRLPLVISCLKQSVHKPCTYYVCSFPNCLKLSVSKKGYFEHEATHRSVSAAEAEKCSSRGTSRKTHATQQAAPSKETFQSCKVELDPLDLSQVTKVRSQSSEKKYQCLYCTQYFYDSSLTGMKSHYMSEHEGQLMVMRDTEARRSQLPSRIYVCEMPNCECCYINRPDLYHHSKSHKANSTYIYECVSCGWYSSSQESATQHLKTAHSEEQNVSLIHMQVSIDENGQTSKKVL
ncbi:serine-rich adhesin for platelets isoform X1 [Biomphalaria glabrata]|nr:serine-rich adhesin for platelets isoform X1 [Biomphalaria glabrata]